jgi:glycine cleavage system H protein
MSYNVPEGLSYSKTHEWVKKMSGNRYRVGVTDYAAQHIGDVTYVELPEMDSEIEREDSNCVIETVKSSEDVYNQISGVVAATNEDVLNDNPELVNSDCYEEGWLYEIESADSSEFKGLMTSSQYKQYLETLED